MRSELRRVWFVVDISAVKILGGIGERALPWGTPALIEQLNNYFFVNWKYEF